MKHFVIASLNKDFCSYLYFTESTVEIEHKNDIVNYKCLLWRVSLNCVPSESRNINRHLEASCKNKSMLSE